MQPEDEMALKCIWVVVFFVHFLWFFYIYIFYIKMKTIFIVLRKEKAFAGRWHFSGQTCADKTSRMSMCLKCFVCMVSTVRRGWRHLDVQYDVNPRPSWTVGRLDGQRGQSRTSRVQKALPPPSTRSTERGSLAPPREEHESMSDQDMHHRWSNWNKNKTQQSLSSSGLSEPWRGAALWPGWCVCLGGGSWPPAAAALIQGYSGVSLGSAASTPPQGGTAASRTGSGRGARTGTAHTSGSYPPWGEHAHAHAHTHKVVCSEYLK